MIKRLDLPLEKRMDQALMTLAGALRRSGRGKKTVLLHSFRVGMMLYQQECVEQAVVAGILHDILEDTAHPPARLLDEYGEEIFHIVQALTLDPALPDALAQGLDSFRRCCALGKEALLVRCADMIDNMPRYALADPESQAFLRTLYESFGDYAKGIEATPLWACYYVSMERYLHTEV